MEHIKKALELAQRERSRDESAGEGLHTDALAGMEARRTPSAAEVAYAQTKSVEVAPESLRKQHIVAGIGPGEFTHCYKILRTKVLQRLQEANANVMAVIGPMPGVGCTMTAINLAISLAMDVNRTVLLVDANLRQPKVHDYFGINPELGLSDYLTRGVSVDQILIHPNIERFVILPAGRALINSSEMLVSPQMGRLVTEFKDRYPSRIVIFDLPPLLPTDDALAFLPSVDSVLLVIERGKTQLADVTRAVNLIRDAGVRLIGTIMNKTEKLYLA